MKRSQAMLGAIAGAAMMPSLAVAQANEPAGQALGRCMVLKTTGADRLAVARWLLGVMASAPQAADVTTLQPGKKPALDRDMAALFTRLLATDCAAESKPIFAAKGGNSQAFQVAGEALGRVAMEELLNNPRTREAMSAYTQYLNREDFKALMPK